MISPLYCLTLSDIASAYQGGEVAISGWVISYLIQHRDGTPSQVGNVTSGFWAGITRKLSRALRRVRVLTLVSWSICLDRVLS
jgi:fucose permease